MRWSFLGRVPYDRGLRLQEQLREEIRLGKGVDTLLLLEHPPVITLGRTARPDHVLVSEAELERRGVVVARIGRGGDVTYHGPGQLVGYPVRAVGRNIRGHVEVIAESLIELLGDLGVEARWQSDHPGIWCATGKVGAIGIDARGGVAIHGFALNVCTHLDDFQMIVPCGLQAPVTSIEAVLGAAVTPSLDEVARRLGPSLCRRYDGVAVEIPAGEVLA